MPARILYVEDDASARRVFAITLRKSGYDVAEAADGAEGWELVRQRAFDVVLTDLNMPEMSGAELCRRIKTDEELSETPVIVFTSHSEVDNEIEGTEAGADAYMSKDTDPRVLRARIEALIKERTRQVEATARKVQSVQRQTLSQSVTTLAHHINNSVMSIHSAATVIDRDNPEHVRKLQQVCRLEARKILSVLKALKTMAEFEELKTTPYLGEDMMFDLEAELSKLDDASTR